MKHLKHITEDKIFKFHEYDKVKYNGNVLLNAVMEWLRAKLLDDEEATEIRVTLDEFLQECKVDKNKFLTFVGENDITKRAKNFTVKIEGNEVVFSDFKNNEEIELN